MSSSFHVYAVSAFAPDRLVADFDTLAEAEAAAWLANRLDGACDYRVVEAKFSPYDGIANDLMDLGCF
jgi:hypothetical protein